MSSATSEKPFATYKTRREREAEVHQHANQVRHAAVKLLAENSRPFYARDLAEKLGTTSFVVERSLRNHPHVIRWPTTPGHAQRYLHINWYHLFAQDKT